MTPCQWRLWLQPHVNKYPLGQGFPKLKLQGSALEDMVKRMAPTLADPCENLQHENASPQKTMSMNCRHRPGGPGVW